MTEQDLVRAFTLVLLTFENWRADEREPEDALAARLIGDVSAAVRTHDQERLRASVRRFYTYVDARFGGATPAVALAQIEG